MKKPNTFSTTKINKLLDLSANIRAKEDLHPIARGLADCVDDLIRHIDVVYDYMDYQEEQLEELRFRIQDFEFEKLTPSERRDYIRTQREDRDRAESLNRLGV